MSAKNPAPMTAIRGGSRNGGIVWRGLDVLANNINRRGITLNRTRKLAMERLATEMEEYAKENAPWTDRTTDAREGLQAQAIHDDSRQSSTVWLGHGVEYGLWLELLNGGEFAIVLPTIEHYQDLVMAKVVEYDSFGSILSQMSFGGGDE